MARNYDSKMAWMEVSRTLDFSIRETQEFMVHDNEVYQKRLVHQFTMGDVDDPELYAAQPLYEWQQTEMGKWVMKHSKDPTYHIRPDYNSFGHQIAITAHITPKRWTEFCLRFIDNKS